MFDILERFLQQINSQRNPINRIITYNVAHPRWQVSTFEAWKVRVPTAILWF